MNGQKRIGSLSLTHSTVGIWTSHDHAWKHILKTIEAPQRYLKVVVLPIPLCAEPLVVAFVQFVGRDPSLGRSNHAKPERCQLRCDQPRKRPLEMIRGHVAPPNESRLSCGALKKDSFHNLRAPPASSAC